MKQEIKICLLDFDGTLVSEDMMSLLAGINGKMEESSELNNAFNKGVFKRLASLIDRINLLAGITKTQIIEFLDKNTYLMPGALDLLKFLKENKIITILASGNVPFVLEYYQKLLGIDYIVGSNPNMDGDKIVGITEANFSSTSFKIDGIQKIIAPMNLKKENIIAIGDSPADKGMFEISGYKIAFNPKGNIADFADVVVEGDLGKVVDLLKNLN